jgi:hypothetical protein
MNFFPVILAKKITPMKIMHSIRDQQNLKFENHFHRTVKIKKKMPPRVITLYKRTNRIDIFLKYHVVIFNIKIIFSNFYY